MKKILYTIAFLLAVSFTANAQTKNMEMKKKFNFMRRFHKPQNSENQRFGIKINPYWEEVSAPHTSNSFIPQIKVPDYNSVWAVINYDSVNINKTFLHTANSGKSWLLDSVEAPANYGLGTIAAIDASTCYASMINGDEGLPQGGGIFKTTDGGYHWRQLAKGKIFDSTSFPDLVYFFDKKNGLAVGDNNGGDTSRLEMYTTNDAGATWLRVSNENLPPTAGSAYSFPQPGYAVQNRFWFFGYDSQGNVYTYITDDLGHHWKLFTQTSSSPIYSYAFTDKQNGLGVSFDDNGLVHQVATHDAGITWTDKSFTGYPMGGFITVIPGTHTFVSTLPGPGATPVYGSSYSNDFGATWNLIDSGAMASHSAVAFLNPLIGWTGRAESADPNGGMFKWKYHFSLDNNNADVSNADITKISLGNENSIKLYPNPSANVLRVEGLQPSVNTKLSVIDVTGRLVQQINTSNTNYTFDIQKLAAGNYYLKIETDKKVTTLKFVKQ